MVKRGSMKKFTLVEKIFFIILSVGVIGTAHVARGADLSTDAGQEILKTGIKASYEKK